MKKFTLIVTLLLGTIAAYAAGPADISGKYLDAGIDGNKCNTCHYITIAKGASEGAVTLSGFFGTTEQINGTYDAESGLLTIAPKQTIKTDEGNIMLSRVDDNGNGGITYKVAVDMVFQFDEKGNAKLVEGLGYGTVRDNEGELSVYNNNNKWLLYSDLSLVKANGNITNYRIQKDATSGEIVPLDETVFETAMVVNADQASGVLYGFDGYTWQQFTIDDNNNVTFVQADVYYHNADYKNGRFVNGPQWGFNGSLGITGTIDKISGTITTGQWTTVLLGVNGGGGSINGNKDKSVITFPKEFFEVVIPDCDNPAADAVGTYVSGSVDNHGCQVSNIINITKGNAKGEVKVTGLMNGEEILNATYDPAKGHLTIPGGQLVTVDKQGNEVHLALMVSSRLYDPSKDIIILLDAEGHGTLAYGFGLCYYYEGGIARVESKDFRFYKANGTIKSDEVDYVEGAPTPIQTSEYATATVFDETGTAGTVYGIAGNCWLNFTVDAENNVQFDWADVRFYSDSYSNARIHRGTGSGGFWTAQGITGVLNMEESNITTDSWVTLLTAKSDNSYVRWGNHVASSIITFGNQPQVLVGDLNGDTYVDIADLNKLINVVLGLDTADPKAADINQDTFVDIADINALINMILGL